MFLATLPGMITPTVLHLSFQLSMIERIISRTLSNLLELVRLCSLKPIYRQRFVPQKNSIG